VEVLVEGPVLAEAVGGAVVAALDVRLAAQAEDALDARVALGVHPAELRAHFRGARKVRSMGGGEAKARAAP
jgi:hypothetical protein